MFSSCFVHLNSVFCFVSSFTLFSFFLCSGLSSLLSVCLVSLPLFLQWFLVVFFGRCSLISFPALSWSSSIRLSLVILSFCQFGIFHVVFFIFLCCLWASQSSSAYVALLHLPLVLLVLSFTFLPAQVISAPYILLYVCSTSAVSFSISAIVACDAMQMPFVLFGLYFSSASHCQCFGCEPPSLLFGVAFFVFCWPFAVFIPSHCVLVS